MATVRITSSSVGVSNIRNGYTSAILTVSAKIYVTTGSETRYMVVYKSIDGGEWVKGGAKTISISTAPTAKSQMMSVTKLSTTQSVRAKIELYASETAYNNGEAYLESTTSGAVVTLRAAYTATVSIKNSVDGTTLASQNVSEGHSINTGAMISQAQLEQQVGARWDHWNTAQDDSGTTYTAYGKSWPSGGKITSEGLEFPLYAFWKQGVNVKVKVNGEWEEGELKAKVNGEWVDAEAAYVKVDGAWIEIN